MPAVLPDSAGLRMAVQFATAAPALVTLALTREPRLMLASGTRERLTPAGISVRLRRTRRAPVASALAYGLKREVQQVWRAHVSRFRAERSTVTKIVIACDLMQPA